MKNKKIIASVLGIACVAILIGVTVITPKKNHTFTPEASEAASNDSWEEKHTPPASGPATLQETEAEQAPATGSADDKTQAVVAEDEKTVVTELNPTVDKEKVQADTKPIAPPADSEKKGRLPSCDMPESTPAPTTAPPAPEPENVPNSEPAAEPENAAPATEAANPENSGHEGQVYDPVFGWVTPGAAQGQVVDNDGDINKQVGTMN